MDTNHTSSGYAEHLQLLAARLGALEAQQLELEASLVEQLHTLLWATLVAFALGLIALAVVTVHLLGS